MKKNKEQANVPALRFPEFRGSGEWGQDIVCNLIRTITPPLKLSSEFYGKEGRYPIVDQSQKYFCGFTDSEQAVISENLPLIVFGDHTCVLKKIDIPFAQGADGIKIIKPKKELHTSFFYQFLLFSPVIMENYKRHFSTLKEKTVCFPDISTGEQQKIADCLFSLDEWVTAESKQLTALKTHKTGLMQQLFPIEGETTPKLRFPEFKNDGAWEEKRLDAMGELVSGLTYKPQDVRDGGLLVLRSSNIQNGKISLKDNVYVRSDICGANLSKPSDILICVRNGSKSLIGKNALLPSYLPRSTHGAFMIVFRASFPEFAYQLLQTYRFNRQVQSDLGATINSINVKQLKKYSFFVPKSSKEQQKIADCLSSLDTLITAQTEKIEQLKQHKKGLMQQLFPVLDGVGA